MRSLNYKKPKPVTTRNGEVPSCYKFHMTVPFTDRTVMLPDIVGDTRGAFQGPFRSTPRHKNNRTSLLSLPLGTTRDTQDESPFMKAFKPTLAHLGIRSGNSGFHHCLSGHMHYLSPQISHRSTPLAPCLHTTTTTCTNSVSRSFPSPNQQTSKGTPS